MDGENSDGMTSPAERITLLLTSHESGYQRVSGSPSFQLGGPYAQPQFYRYKAYPYTCGVVCQ